MTQVTVKELAEVVDTPVERLLQQMREAGLSHTSAEQVVTDNEKQALLAHLKSSHGEKVEEPRKITLQRKTTSHPDVLLAARPSAWKCARRRPSSSAARKSSKPRSSVSWKSRPLPLPKPSV